MPAIGGGGIFPARKTQKYFSYEPALFMMKMERSPDRSARDEKLLNLTAIQANKSYFKFFLNNPG